MTELPETMVAPDDPVVAAVDGRRASLRLARVHLRLGSLSLARAELEALRQPRRPRRRRAPRPRGGALADR